MQQKSDSTVSFVIPALNEEKVIRPVLEDIVGTCREYLREFEVIAVNDGSADRTGEIMDEVASEFPEVRVIHNVKNENIGAAYKKGIKLAKFDYYMLLCGDGGLPAESLPKLFSQLGNADIIVPYMTNLKRIKTPFRYFISRTYTGILNLIFRLDIKYYNGLPIHRLKRLREIEISSDGFGFQGEILIKLIRTGNSYVQVPILGAENTNKSSALKIKSIWSVGATFFNLLKELNVYFRR